MRNAESRPLKSDEKGGSKRQRVTEEQLRSAETRGPCLRYLGIALHE